MRFSKMIFRILPLVIASSFFWGCGTTIQGRVVMPDGTAMADADVVVYTLPRTASIKAAKDGSFSLSGAISPEQEYTLIAEDREGNLGYVKGFKPKKGSNKNVVVRMSREVEGKDAVMEGGPTDGSGSGMGEKILKSSP
jgi:hypothetical protein